MVVISHSLAYFLLRRENWGNILPKAHFQGKLAFKLIMHVIFSLYECKIATLLTLVGTYQDMYVLYSLCYSQKWDAWVEQHYNRTFQPDEWQISGQRWLKKAYDGFYEPQAGIFCVEALDLCIVLCIGAIEIEYVSFWIKARPCWPESKAVPPF